MLNLILSLLTMTCLASPLETLGTKKLIAIGESGHAVAQYHLQRSAISKQLIEHFGFRNIFIEEDLLSGFAIADAIDSCRKPKYDREAVRRAFGNFEPATYRHNEFYPFYHFLCEWNQKNPKDPVRFYGVDVWSNYWDIRKYLEKNLATANPQISLALKTATQSCFLWSLDNANDYPTHPDWIYYEKHKRIDPQRNQTCLVALNTLTSRLNEVRNQIPQYARISLLVTNGIYQQQIRDVYSPDFRAALNLRDAFQAHALIKLDQKKGTIFLAHNLHVFQKMSVVPDPGWDRVTSSGEWLKKRYQQQMAVIGMGGFHIESLRDGVYPEPTSSRSIDFRLHQLGKKTALVDARRFTGDWYVHNETEAEGLFIKPIEQFDYYYFIDQSAAATLWKL